MEMELEKNTVGIEVFCYIYFKFSKYRLAVAVIERIFIFIESLGLFCTR